MFLTWSRGGDKIVTCWLTSVYAGVPSYLVCFWEGFWNWEKKPLIHCKREFCQRQMIQESNLKNSILIAMNLYHGILNIITCLRYTNCQIT